MSWETLAPIAKRVGASLVSVVCRKNKAGALSVQFNFSAFIEDDFGKPKRASVEVGTGDDVGKVRFQFGDEGGFDAKSFGKGGFRLILPPIAGAPDRDWGREDCSVIEQDTGGGSLVVGLPLAAWGRSAAPRLNGGVNPAPPPPPGAPAPIRPMDAVEYLTSKGHKVTKLAEGRWSLDGDTVVKGAVVKAINKHRGKAGLDPLNIESVC
jgi:hypothetical protein